MSRPGRLLLALALTLLSVPGACSKLAEIKSLEPGKTYNFSFAVHDDNITTRGHHVSFPMTVGFGTKASIEATRLK